jgi:hypothetical protein
MEKGLVAWYAVHGQGKGPWVMADLENGLWAGDQKVSSHSI